MKNTAELTCGFYSSPKWIGRCFDQFDNTCHPYKGRQLATEDRFEDPHSHIKRPQGYKN